MRVTPEVVVSGRVAEYDSRVIKGVSSNNVSYQVSTREIVYQGTGLVRMAVSQGKRRWVEVVWVQEVEKGLE